MVTIPFLTIGSPLLDVIAKVNDEFLLKYDLLKNNATLIDETKKNLYEELENCSYNAGGTSANTARILQWLSRNNTAYFVGAIGNDDYGKIFQEVIRKAGVTCLLQQYDLLPTGKCAVLINDKNRSLCTDLGASISLKFDTDLWKWIELARIIYVPVKSELVFFYF